MSISPSHSFIATPSGDPEHKSTRGTTHLRAARVRADQNCHVQIDVSTRTVALYGELDFANRYLLTRAGHELLSGCLRGNGHPNDALCDMRGLRFIDAAGIGALVEVLGRFNDAGITVRLANATPSVRKLLVLCQLEHDVRDSPVDQRDPSPRTAKA